MNQNSTNHDSEYLGDGVYAAHDGYQVWLRVGSHMNPPIVALEPEVLARLQDYAERHKLTR